MAIGLPVATIPMARTFAEAIELLTSRSSKLLQVQHPDKARLSRPNNYYMREWLMLLGHDMQQLNVIHITGTKGKGSTCAFTESLLRSHSQRARTSLKTGLYTSPHLQTERERIRIDFKPVTEAVFAKYLFEVWERLSTATQIWPGYLQLLTLLSIHIFISEGVDIAIYEVHAGGRHDATNIFEKPIACGFTPIGLDHIPLLGRNVKDIAWHKSGIMKSGSPAFSVAQREDVTEVLKAESDKIGCNLTFVPDDIDQSTIPKTLVPAEIENLSLAIRLANAYLSRTNKRLDNDDISSGIDEYYWPGRFQLIEIGLSRWYLDIAHNEISIPVALAWFCKVAQEYERTAGRQSRVLIFGSPTGRDAAKLMDLVVQFCNSEHFYFDKVMLTAYVRRVDGMEIFDLEVAELQKASLMGISSPPTVMSTRSVQDALNLAQQEGSIQALIFGSSHLISNAYSFLLKIGHQEQH
ncbi:putative tetrahydrofolylpolyglutamate synthase [Xylaria palmicola]|nr:putative tetrahydrofolylpolyglutamate synthase [Xylaria palmicola]